MIFDVFIVSFFKVQFVYPASFYAIVAGALWIFSTITYAKALMMEEATRVISLFYLSPILTTILAVIFLNEILTPFKYVGIVLLVLSAILVSQKKVLGQMKFIPALKIVLLGIPIMAIIAVIEKFSLSSIDFISFYFWFAAGAGSMSLLLLSSDKLRLDFGTQFFLLKNKGVLGFTILIEVVIMIAILTGLWAISLAPVSLVSAVASTQPFFLVVFSLVLSFFFPHLIKEEFNRQTILIKLISVLLIFAGGWLVVS